MSCGGDGIIEAAGSRNQRKTMYISNQLMINRQPVTVTPTAACTGDMITVHTRNLLRAPVKADKSHKVKYQGNIVKTVEEPSESKIRCLAIFKSKTKWPLQRAYKTEIPAL